MLDSGLPKSMWVLAVDATVHTENSISLRQRYRIINLSKTYERYMYRY